MAVADLDLDAVEADAREKLERLREQAALIAPEALVDPDVAEELALVESEIGAAETAIERSHAARVEIVRRDAEAKAKAEVEACAEALKAAKVTDVERLRAVADVDAACRKVAHALADLVRLTGQESVELVRAGRGRLEMPKGVAVAGALTVALTEVGLKRGVAELPLVGNLRPLVDVVRPVDFEVRERAPRQQAPRRSVQPSGSKVRMVASSPRLVYRELRGQGFSREAARAEISRSFGRRIDTGILSSDDVWLTTELERAEREFEQERKEAR